MGTHLHKPDFTAKGDLLIGTAASTETVLGVGSNTQILTADSTQTTGIKWAAPTTSFSSLTVTGAASIKAGSSSGTIAKVGGTIFDHFADAGNVTTGETDLYTDTAPASVLGTNGDKLLAQYGGVFVSSGTATREVKLYFGGTAIFDTGALTLSLSSAWSLDCLIIRVSSTVVRYKLSFTTEGAALAAYTAAGELTGLTLSNTNVLKITGQAAGVGAATNDIVAKLSTVSWQSAA